MPIHVIDDEIIITDLIAEALKYHSDQVLCFHSAEEYITQMNSESYTEPRLIITDVIMGGMDGFELIKAVRENGSEAKTIVMSGFFVCDNLADQEFDSFLAKPFSIELLQSTVSELLSNGNARTGINAESGNKIKP